MALRRMVLFDFLCELLYLSDVAFDDGNRSHQERQVQLVVALLEIASILPELPRYAPPMRNNASEVDFRARQLGPERIDASKDFGDRFVFRARDDLNGELVIPQPLNVNTNPLLALTR